MNPSPITCDPRRIERFLAQELSVDEQREFERHLDTCDECRQQLESAAASDDVWSGVRESLQHTLSESASQQDDGATCDASDASMRREGAFDQQRVLELLAPSDDERMLGRLGAYEIVGVIGSGGMGVVLKGFDAALNRYVAIKVLAPHLASSGAARKRFSREAQAAAAVVHENVIEIHGVADAWGLPYLVMPYVPGPSLQRRLDAEGPLELNEVLRIGVQAAKGLAAAHAQGLVHRDVKPANILLADGIERVKLTDFGLARAADDASVTKTGYIAGTPQYMSPEQARGETVDARSDLFSLGSVLYALCTGRAPFRAETSYGMLRRITDDEPRPIREINPAIPDWLTAIITRLMAKSADDRFQAAGEVAELLEACLAHVQQPAVVSLPEACRAAAASRTGRRGPVFRLLVAAALAVPLIFAGVLIVLELDKGKLTIESDVDDVEVRVLRSDKVVKSLTVTRRGSSVRIAAGRYHVEIIGPTDGLTVENDTVTLNRGGQAVVKIVKQQALDGPIMDETPAVTDALDSLRPGFERNILERLHDAHLKLRRAEREFGTGLATESDVERAKAELREAAMKAQPVLAKLKAQFAAQLEDPDAGEAAKTELEGDWRLESIEGAARGTQVPPRALQVRGDRWRTISPKSGDTLYRFVLDTTSDPKTIELLTDEQTPLEMSWRADYDLQGDTLRIVQHSRRDGRPELTQVWKRIAPGDTETAPQENGTANTTGEPQAMDPADRELRSRRVMGIVPEHLVRVVAFSPDGKLFAVAGDRDHVTIFQAESGRLLATIRLLSGEEEAILSSDEVRLPKSNGKAYVEIRALAFSPDSRVLAVGNSIGQVKLLRAPSGEFLRSLDAIDRNRDDLTPLPKLLELPLAHRDVAAVAFSPDGKILATCGSAIDYRQDGIRRLGAGPSAGLLLLWDATTGKLLQDLEGEHNGQVLDVAFSPDGKYLASAGNWRTNDSAGSGVKLWDPQTGKVFRVLPVPNGHLGGGTPLSISFSPDGKRLALGLMKYDKSTDITSGAISIYYPASGILDLSWSIPRSARPVKFTADGKFVAAQTDNNTITFFDAKTGESRFHIETSPQSNGRQWHQFAVSPTNNTVVIVGSIAGGRRSTIEIWRFGADTKADD